MRKCADIGEHKIRTVDDMPVAQSYRRIPHNELSTVREHLQELLDDGSISESASRYASPIVIVKNKSGEMRMCIDYRKLNEKIVKDKYPLPRIDDTLDALNGATLLTSFDLKAAYSQVRIVTEDREKTAFISPLGLYEYNRIPFGLVNAPATFQRIMSNVFREFNLRGVVCYLDDILIYSNSPEEHEVIVRNVLLKLRSVGLQLNAEKCNFFCRSVVRL